MSGNRYAKAIVFIHSHLCGINAKLGVGEIQLRFRQMK